MGTLEIGHSTLSSFVSESVPLGDLYMWQTNVECEAGQCYSVVGVYDGSSFVGN